MICNVCGTQDATLHLTEIVNNKMVEIHLCENCSQEKGSDFKSHFNLSEVLAGVAKEAVLPEQFQQQSTLKCSQCDLTYSQFSKSGRLGCAHCYDAFHKMLVPMLRRIQKSVEHVGKKPSRISSTLKVNHDLKKLQEQLKKSIESEEFEAAAQIRDEIKKIQQKLSKANKNK